jgi:hypothetical protein
MLRKINNTITRFTRWLFNPTRALEREYGRLLVEARDLQRKGDIPAFAKKTAAAEDIRKKIEELQNN